MISDLIIHLYEEDNTFLEATVVRTNPDDELMLANLLTCTTCTCGIYKEKVAIILAYKNGEPFSAVSLDFNLEEVATYLSYVQSDSYKLIMSSTANSFSPEWSEENLRHAVKCRRALRKLAQMRDAIVVAYDGVFYEEATRFAEAGFKVTRIFEEHLFINREFCMCVGMHLAIIKKQCFGREAECREAEEIQKLIEDLFELNERFALCRSLKKFRRLKNELNNLIPCIDNYMKQYEDDGY